MIALRSAIGDISKLYLRRNIISQGLQTWINIARAATSTAPLLLDNVRVGPTTGPLDQLVQKLT
jgi:hypothetical protein